MLDKKRARPPTPNRASLIECGLLPNTSKDFQKQKEIAHA